MSKLNLKERVVSSLIILPLAIMIIYIGGIFYSFLLALASALVFYELSKINDSTNIIRSFFIYLILLILCTCFLIFYSPIYAIFSCIIFVFSLLLYRAIRGENYWLEFNLIYSIIPIIILFDIRGYPSSPDGLALTTLVISTAVISDIAGYSGGMLLGTKKIFPKLSPNKTLEGTVFALIIPTLLISLIFIEDIFNYKFLILLVFLMSIASIAGDLFISGIKRKFNKKNTGNLIPGHGGLLDRADSIIGATIAFLVVTYVYAILGIKIAIYL